MGWLFITIAIIGSAGATLINRSVLRNVSPVAYTFCYNVLSAILFLPLASSKLIFPQGAGPWVLIVFASAMWAITGIVSMTAHKHTEASIRSPLSQTRLIWLLPLSFFVLHEPTTWLRSLGVFVIFFGVFALLWHPESKLERFKGTGVLWSLLYGFLAAVMAVVDKVVVQFFNPDLYGFLAFLFPAFILGIVISHKIKDVRFILKNHPAALGLSAVFVAATYYGMLHAYKILDVSIAYPLIQLSTLVAVLGGIVLLKERAHLWQKIMAAVIIIVGSIILKLG